MKTKVYIDGQAGTTGLQIYERIGKRADLELLRIDEDKRHDLEERKKFLNMADIVFLCLPDAGAIEAVSLIENPDVRVIDASTAHRTSDDWTYGYPELSADHVKVVIERIMNHWKDNEFSEKVIIDYDVEFLSAENVDDDRRNNMI